MMMDGWSGYGGGTGVIGGILMMVFWVAIIVAIVLLVVWLVRQMAGGPATGAPGTPTYRAAETPLDILKSRYARGEIDKVEFEEKKKDLTS
ncbi:MAG: SHOCT domain-containing protein [Thermoleophilia bacterium]